MRKLEEDIQIHSYLSNEKLPKEIEAKRAIVHDLAKVASQPALDQKDIEQIKKMVIIETRFSGIHKLLQLCNSIIK